jgi:hypothetical protein
MSAFINKQVISMDKMITIPILAKIAVGPLRSGDIEPWL